MSYERFKINGKQKGEYVKIRKMKMPKKGEYVRFENYERKIKSLFMIYTDFESILVLEDNGKQIQMSLMQTNIKNILDAVMTRN